MKTDQIQTLLKRVPELWRDYSPHWSLRTWVLVGLIAAVLAGANLGVNARLAIVQRSVRVKQDRLTELQRANAQLRHEIAALISPVTLEPRARALGLGPAQAKAVIYADLPNLQPEIADVLPAFEPLPAQPRVRPDLAAQFGMWVETMRQRLGLPLVRETQAAPPETR